MPKFTPFLRRLFLWWPVSRCARAAGCFYAGQSPGVQNPIRRGGGGKRLEVGLSWWCCVKRSKWSPPSSSSSSVANSSSVGTVFALHSLKPKQPFLSWLRPPYSWPRSLHRCSGFKFICRSALLCLKKRTAHRKYQNCLAAAGAASATPRHGQLLEKRGLWATSLKEV